MAKKKKQKTRWFRTTSTRLPCIHGLEVEIEADQTQDDIDKCIAEYVAQFVNYGVVEIDGPNGKELT